MAIAQAPFRAHRRARDDASVDLTFLTLRRSTVVNDLGGEEVKNLTSDFGPHPDLITTHGRLACLQTTAARDVTSRSSDLDGLGVDGGLCVVWAMLSPPGGPETARVEAWRGAFRAPDIREPLPIVSRSRR